VIFNSLTFLIFFAIVLSLHYLPLGWRIKKLNLLVASYLFYAAWNPPFVLLLFLTAVADFSLARWMGRINSGAGRRTLLAIGLASNLGLLAYFKYGAFLLENLAALLGILSISYRPSSPGVLLPLGLSFYTFESVSYLVDVYRRKISPWNTFLDYALFLTFFPHLVAGPIVRAGDFLPQCREPRRATSDQMGWGLSLLVMGLFQKVILADSLLAPVVDIVYDGSARAGFMDAWIGTLAFAGQIYFDFAGYSACAIGLAHCFGFVLKDNFHCPYAATSLTDFWRRWHISLSTWLRDYLYIPLGGGRLGPARTSINLVITMLLGGLWHGASWHFVAWGGLHGAFLVGERLLGIRPVAHPPSGRRLRQLPAAMLTFTLVCLSWVFFRARDLHAANGLVVTMLCGGPSYHRERIGSFKCFSVVILITLMLSFHWMLRDTSVERAVERLPWWLRGLGLAAMLACLAMPAGGDRAFIYFQF
jgi:alginate O-acetyltransferase complex protein AlgI